jgi:hypothetical protein
VAAELGGELSLDVGVQLGRVADALEAQTRRARNLASRLWVVNGVPIGLWNTATSPGVFDPGANTTGPNDGYFWAIHRVTAATFTAGSINMYRGQAGDQNLLFQFTQAGAFYPPRTNLILKPGDRLTFAAATALTGNVILSMDITQGALDVLPDFLL